MSPRQAFADATWTDARIALLEQLWGEGASHSQIAAALGGVSRSAVIGKVRRLALPTPERKPPPRRSTRPHGARLRWTTARQAQLASAARASSAIALDQLNATIPLEQRRTLLQLTRSTCRWPIGEPGRPEFFFCGGRVEQGRPYCAGHCGFAYERAEGPSLQSAHVNARPAPSSRMARSSARV